MKQRELPFDDPPGFEDLARYVGRNIAKSECDTCVILERPIFNWRFGRWQALANLNGMLCMVALAVRREKYEMVREARSP